ncbi:MAG TPA: VOC family protein [Nitrospiraceae bacterium]|nr:VOC family protein [Nitrospiraceae bacterium]
MKNMRLFTGCWMTATLVFCAVATPLFADNRAAVLAVESIGMTVSDMDRSVAFYSDVLTFKPVSDVEIDGLEYDQLWGIFGVRVRVVRMQLGEQYLELIQFLAPPDVRPVPVPSYSNDLWFQHIAIVVRDMKAAWAHLRRHHVRQISPRPQTIPISNPAAAGIQAIKFRDPDGHNLELLWFPEGKGNPVWQRPTNDLFLGIDHTAMTVRSTENSIMFYRDRLGMTVGGGTLNMGVEQEHLDSLPGARARVTGMRPVAGTPGVEFLEYESPMAGRPMPGDSHPTDLWHWQTTVVVPDVEAVALALRPTTKFVSPAVVTLREKMFGFGKGVLVRDPDGHAILIVSP